MDKQTAQHKRKLRLRSRLKRLPMDRPRLTAHTTNHHAYAQIIDDAQGHTLAAASSLDESFGKDKFGADVDSAKAVGKLLAERAVKAGVKQVRFDRGGKIFHGRIRALAEGAREGGLDF
jgi:large subunit ribosomal protein L18